MANEIAVKNAASLELIGDYDFGDGGFGDITSSDIVMSRIGVIGDLSPQKKKGNAKFIEGVEVGDIVDISNGTILAEGFNSKDPKTVKLLPFARVKEVIEWKPRTQGGGIVSREILSENMETYAPKRKAKQDEKFAWLLPNGNELIETWQVYCIDVERQVPVFVPFKKSALKMIRPWFTNRANLKFPAGTPHAGKRQPLYARLIEIGSFLDSGNNNEWPNFTIKDAEGLAEVENALELRDYAQELLKQLQEGNVKLDESGMQDEDDDKDVF